MGDWRTIELKGNVHNEEDVNKIIKYLTVSRETYNSEAYDYGIYYLQFGTGLCGINQWVNEDGTIDICGNVYERDCEVEDLQSELTILANKFHSLDMVLHVGDNYESKDCVVSFMVKNGKVEKVDPMISELSGIDNGRMMSNLFKALR